MPGASARSRAGRGGLPVPDIAGPPPLSGARLTPRPGPPGPAILATSSTANDLICSVHARNTFVSPLPAGEPAHGTGRYQVKQPRAGYGTHIAPYRVTPHLFPSGEDAARGVQ
ncbi:hypothetical protein FHX69_0564 [Prauserella muralis]|nr:hypothetical protein FHX69_0564 [Prauserella muralis]